VDQHHDPQLVGEEFMHKERVMFKITLDPQEEYVGVTVESEADAAHFCKAAAEVVSGVEEYDQVPAYVRNIYEGYATQMCSDLTGLWSRHLWDYEIPLAVAPHVRVTTTFGVAVLEKLGII
jgi:hypothetical protein